MKHEQVFHVMELHDGDSEPSRSSSEDIGTFSWLLSICFLFDQRSTIESRSSLGSGTWPYSVIHWLGIIGEN